MPQQPRSHGRPVRVTLLSEHDILHAGVHGLLAPHGNRVRLVEPGAEPDVVVYDVYGLHAGDGEDLELAIKCHPGRVLALSRELQPGLTARALELGAVAAVSIAADETQLLDAIEALAGGHLQDGSQEDLDNRAELRRWLGRDVNLSPREQDVLGLIVGGRSNAQVAAELFLSINSVKTVIRSIYRKVGVTSRSQAVAWGVEHGFPPAGEPTQPTATGRFEA